MCYRLLSQRLREMPFVLKQKWPWNTKIAKMVQNKREMRHPNDPKSTAVAPHQHARQTDAGSAAHGPVPQTAVQCHLEAPETAAEGPTWHTSTGVPRISAGVHLRFGISASATCTLRPFRRWTQLIVAFCWFCSHHTTNPFLIPLGREGDATKPGAAEC